MKILNKFTLLFLVTFFSIGLCSTAAFAAGPTPKIVIPIEKSFYMTPTPYFPDLAPSACVEGFHFASWLEIWDSSSLSYNTNFGLTKPDSGLGPPANELGWIRTGSQSGEPMGNCDEWGTQAQSSEGTIAVFSMWVLIDGGNPLDVVTSECNVEFPVWCVSDPVY